MLVNRVKLVNLGGEWDTHMLAPSPLPLSHCTDLLPSSAKKNTEKTQFSPHSPIFRINLEILLVPISKSKESPVSRCAAVDLQKLLPLSNAAGWNCHSTGLLRSNSIFIVNVIFRIIAFLPKSILYCEGLPNVEQKTYFAQNNLSIWIQREFEDHHFDGLPSVCCN